MTAKMLLSIITGAMTGWAVAQIIIEYPLEPIHLIAYIILMVPGIIYMIYLYFHSKKLKKLIDQELERLKKIRESYE